MGRKVAIVAKAGTSALAPWHDPSWEIWGLPWIEMPRADRLFEVHEQACVDAETDPNYKDDAWLHKALKHYGEVEVFCHPSRMGVFPNAKAYPYEEVNKAIPFNYFENSIAYQIALAIYEGVEEIALFGVHMVGRNEFVWERPSVTYLIGFAQGRGIKISIAPGSPLFMSGYSSGRYGVDTRHRDMSIITGAPREQTRETPLANPHSDREFTHV